jgi:hypothetical protein
MGHLSAVGRTPEEAREAVMEAYERLERPGLGTGDSGHDVEGRGRVHASSRQPDSERPVPSPESPVPDS